MRILHLTDTHLGIKRHFRGAPPDWTRASDHLRAFRAALDLALHAAPRVDLVIHSGDLFDRSHPPGDAVVAAIAAFAEVAREVPVLLVPGNHDRLGLLHQAGGALGHVPGLTVTDSALAVDVAGVRIGLVPFQREPPAWAAAARALGDCDVLVAHQAFHGARAGGFRFVAGADGETIGPQQVPPRTRTILCGHIHPRQRGVIGPANVFYTGSTERTAFSERHEIKGCGLLDLDRSVRYTPVDLPTRPMVELHAEADATLVLPGSLVRLAGPARTREIEEYIIGRGGWVSPWRDDAPVRQVGLFG